MATEQEIEDIFTYHAPTDGELVRMNEIRAAAKALAMALVKNMPACADQSAALRKLREVSMTANAGIVLNRPPPG